MRVLIIRSNPVQPDSRVEKEAESLLLAGYEIDILGWDRSSDYELEKGIKKLNGVSCDIYRVGIKATYGGGFKKNLIPLLKLQMEIGKFIKNNHKKYDVIHACDFDTCLTSYFYAQRYRLKIVYDVFDYYVDSFHVPLLVKGIIRGIDKYIMDHVNALIICSEERIQQINKVKQKNIVIIHNTPKNCELNKTLLIKEDSSKCKIVYVGILSHGRMILDMLEFAKKNSDFELHIAGFGILEQIVHEYARENENIFYYGKIEYNDTLALEAACDVMTAIYDPNVPNHKYAAPNKFYEALMLGKPLVMVKETGFSEVVEKQQIGITIEYNYESLEAAFDELNKKRYSWADISRKEKALYEKYYSWQCMSERLLKLYSELE